MIFSGLFGPGSTWDLRTSVMIAAMEAGVADRGTEDMWEVISRARDTRRTSGNSSEPQTSMDSLLRLRKCFRRYLRSGSGENERFGGEGCE